MTFNIRCHAYLPKYNEGVNEWPNRSALNVALIRKLDPDVIAFQELERHSHLATYDTELADYDRFIGPVYGNPNLSAYVPVFWKRRRLELLAAGGFWLSPTPAVYSIGWDADCVRSAAWVLLRDLPSGLTCFHLNTHLDHIGQQSMAESVRLILTQLPQLAPPAAPQILTGDFNCKPGAVPYQLLQADGFVDTFVAARNTDTETYTYHGYTGTDPDKSWRIDWILVRGLPPRASITRCAIVRDAQPPLYPSDHFPVVADLAIA